MLFFVRCFLYEKKKEEIYCRKNLTFQLRRVKLYTRKQVSLGNNFCIGLSFELTVQLGREIIQPAFFFLCPEISETHALFQQFEGGILDFQLALLKGEALNTCVENFQLFFHLFCRKELIDELLRRRNLDRY